MAEMREYIEQLENELDTKTSTRPQVGSDFHSNWVKGLEWGDSVANCMRVTDSPLHYGIKALGVSLYFIPIPQSLLGYTLIYLVNPLYIFFVIC